AAGQPRDLVGGHRCTAHESRDGDAVGAEGGDEGTADETGCAGDDDAPRHPCGRHRQLRVASSVISTPASACETGQPAFASSAMRVKSSADRPGTTAETLRWLPVMPLPGTNVTDAVASMLVGG